MNGDGKTLLVLGGTGLVGGEVLKSAALCDEVKAVVAPTRRPLKAGCAGPKVLNPALDYERIDPGLGWWKADALICCLGTTIKKAGSRQNFYRVDHDYPILAARAARKNGVRTCVLISAIGADPHSSIFYNRVKGETEEDMKKVGFESLAFLRPNVLSGGRREFRLGEEMMIAALTVVGPLLPKKFRLCPAENVARVALRIALRPWPGVGVVGSEDMSV